MVQVLPTIPVNDASNCRKRDKLKVMMDLFGVLAGIKHRSHSNYLGSSQDRSTASNFSNKSAFVASVEHVFAVRPKEQMVWPNAWRIVASMANLNPIRYGPKRKQPRITMGRDDSCPVRELPISVRITTAVEQPAIASFDDPSPKPMWNIVLALLRTKILNVPFNSRSFTVENLPADSTLRLHLKLFLSGVCGAWSDFRASLPSYSFSRKESMCH